MTDTETFFKLNNKDKPNDLLFIFYKKNLMNEYLKYIKDRNNMKTKFTNYDIKDVFSQNLNMNLNSMNIKMNEHYEFLLKNILAYLVEKKFYPEMNQPPVPGYQPPSQNTTLASTDAQNQINLNNLNRPQPNIQISQDKWLDSFQIYEFKNFIFCRKFVVEFYSNLKYMIEKINNLINLYKNNTEINLTELKSDLEMKLENEKGNLDIINYSTFSFMENFYFFTVFFLKEYSTLYKRGILFNNNISTKEIKEYFESTHCFFYTLRNYNSDD